MDTFEMEHHGDLVENYRLLDAAETLVNLQSMQEQQQQQQSLEGSSLIFLASSTSPNSSSVQISPLSSPILHQLAAATPYVEQEAIKSGTEPIELRIAGGATAEGASNPELDLRVRTPENGALIDLTLPTQSASGGLHHSPRQVIVPMGPPPEPPSFVMADNASSNPPVTNSYQQPVCSEMMRPPPPPPKRGRGRGRGSSSGERGGRGRGRGRGRGAKASVSVETVQNNTGVNGNMSQGISHATEQDKGSSKANGKASATTSEAEMMHIGDMSLKLSVLDRILNEKKLELLGDPDVQALISRSRIKASRKKVVK